MKYAPHLAALALIAAASAQAQTPLYTSPPPPWINGIDSKGTVKPYELLPGGMVTFRYKSPGAQSVAVAVGTPRADLHTYPMTKDDNGVWSVTIGPVPPEIYPYVFQLAGGTADRGEIEVKGAAPAIYDAQDVPHGSFTTLTYLSKTLNRRRDMSVYLPPDYYSQPERRFPVIYNYDDPGNSAGLHYTEVMDNLIAQKKAVPMIVVMLTDASVYYRDNPETGRAKNAQEMRDEVVPLIEGRYRILPGRTNRALTGISHNAGATWTTGLADIDLFGNIGMFSSGMFGGLLPDPSPGGFALYEPWEPEKVLPAATKKLLDPATRPKLFYLAVGNIDPRLEPTRKAVEEMRTYGVDPVFMVYPGGHQDKAFRPSFIGFVTRVFQ